MALPDCPVATHLNNPISSNSLHLDPFDPTHHQHQSNSYTWIDLFVVKSHDHGLVYRNSHASLTWHNFIKLPIACSKPPPVAKLVSLRDLKRVDLGDLKRCPIQHIETAAVPSPFPTNTFNATTPNAELVLVSYPIDVDRCDGLFITLKYFVVVQSFVPQVHYIVMDLLMCQTIIHTRIQTIFNVNKKSLLICIIIINCVCY